MTENKHKPDCPWYFISPDLSDLDLDAMDDTPCFCFEEETPAMDTLDGMPC